jgi:phosphomannomutase
MQTGNRENATVIFANDPDADRLAMSEKGKDGKWRIFTGDQIGSIFAHYFVSQYKGDLSKCAMVASTVSSKLIKAIAEKNKAKFEETLTGFKWIANKVLDLEKQGYNVLVSYEEAIGFCIGDIVRDKDGITGAACLAELYAQLCEKGMTFADYMEEIYKTYGYYLTKNHYFLCYDPEKMKKIFDAIRNNGNYPARCGDFAIKNIRDLTTGYDTNQSNHKAILPTSSSTQMITFGFENGANCTLRGSGTEPKLKFYIECHDANKEKAQEILKNLHAAIVENFLKPTFYGLDFPKA